MEGVDDIIKRISTYSDVLGLIVMNNEGILIKSTLDRSLTAQYVPHMNQLIEATKTCVAELDPHNRLTVVRMQTKKNEIMVVPEKDYTLVVVRDRVKEEEDDKERSQ